MVRLGLAALTAALVAGIAPAAGSGSASPAGYDPPPSPSPTPPSPPPPSVSGPRALVGTVGPNNTISLRRASGARVRRLPAGRYTIAVDDRSAEHNFHLYGPGVNRRTGTAFMGQARWTVRFRKGKTYRFRCDPHLFSMRGSFRAR